MKPPALTSFTLILVCLLGTALYAGYTVDLDYAAFRAGDSLSYVEVYAAVQKSSLIHEIRGDSVDAAFSLALAVLSAGIPLVSDTFAGGYSAPRTEPDSGGAFFPYVFRFYLRPGRYDMVATLSQDAPREQISDSLVVADFSGDRLQFSDLELGCWMKVDTAGTSLFEKNSVHLLPNATRFWGEQLPMAYYYAEAYGLDYDAAQVDSYAVHRHVTRAEDGKSLLSANTVRRATGATAVIADGFPVATLRTGVYFLDLQIQSFRSGKTVALRKKFWTFRAGDFAAGRTPVMDRELQSRMFASAPDIVDVISPDSALTLMRYLFTTVEQDRVDQLNDDGRARFLREFWLTREAAEPGCGNRYFARIAEANERFEVLHRPGWKTDRGRAFALYGEPDQVERNYMPSGSYNSEIWHYDRLEGGVIFAFVDYNEYGDMELVHSTKRGEIYNPNWEKQVTGRRHQLPSNSNVFEADR
jgi:GWxTD domain-containing protein